MKVKVIFESGTAGMHRLHKTTLIFENGETKIFRTAEQFANGKWTRFGCNWYGENGSVDKEHIEIFEKHLKEASDYKKEEIENCIFEIDEYNKEKYGIVKNEEREIEFWFLIQE